MRAQCYKLLSPARIELVKSDFIDEQIFQNLNYSREMICILRKTEHILVVFVVKQIVNTPTTITRLVNTENAHTAVAVGCLDQHEYSLMKTLLIL